jgi:hypothetical protein
VGLSFLVGAGINLLNSGQLNSPSLIRHGELFAISASLLVGAMRLVSKDDGLEAFSGRQVVTILVFGIALAAQAGYVLLKLVNDGLLKDKFAYVLEGCSVYAIVIVLVLVFFITLLDASRLEADKTLDAIENDYKSLDSRWEDRNDRACLEDLSVHPGHAANRDFLHCGDRRQRPSADVLGGYSQNRARRTGC